MVRLGLCLLLGLAMLGCSGSWGNASGEVTVDGTALKEGVITFHPVEGGATAYGQVTAGAFTISTGQKTGLKAGKYRVTVSAMTIPEPGSTETAKMLTPVKYSRTETTDLEATVTGGSNRFKFELRTSP